MIVKLKGFMIVCGKKCKDAASSLSFYYAGQIPDEVKGFILKQIKLQLVDGEVKRSKASLKHWVRHSSAAIKRTASRNILFSVDSNRDLTKIGVVMKRMRSSILVL